MIEVHHQPEKALCDGAQSLKTEFQDLVPLVKDIFNIKKSAAAMRR